MPAGCKPTEGAGPSSVGNRGLKRPTLRTIIHAVPGRSTKPAGGTRESAPELAPEPAAPEARSRTTSSQVRQTGMSSQAGWYAVYTRSRHEKAVAQYLQRQHVET